MNSIEKLIFELSPDGVEYKTLGEMGEFIRGTGLQKKDLLDSEGVPAIHYGQIHTTYGISTSRTISFTSHDIAARLRHACPGDLLIATTSEDDEAVAKATAWLGDEEVVLSGDAFIYRHRLEPRYVSYFFQSEHFQSQKRRYISGAKVRRISGVSLAKILIPVPPPEIQRKIAEILDRFSNLQAELQAELAARVQQYEHYSRYLLEESLESGQFTVATVDELCAINRGRVISKDYLAKNPGPYPVYSSQTANEGIFGFIDTYDFDDEESITWTTDGANAGSVFYHKNKKFNITNVCGRLVVQNDRITPRYLYFQLRQRAKRFVHAGMGNPKLMANHMGAIPIPVPSLNEQHRVVEILDRFDALINDLSVGLPAEISARRQQYEYYRDKLLTFKELETVS